MQKALTDWYRPSDELVMRTWWGDKNLWATLDNIKPKEISDELWAEFCHCANRRDGFMHDEVSNHWVHVACGKVRPHLGAIFQCDNCENYYKVQFVPDRLLLCPGCLKANED